MARVLAALLVVLTLILQARADGDEDVVRDLLMRTFDKPDSRLVVGPIVIARDHALVDWSQAATGGRALLRRSRNIWELVLCSGDGIRSAKALQQAGVPAADAHSLSKALAAAEKAVAAERLKLFSSFEGTVRMTDGGRSDQ